MLCDTQFQYIPPFCCIFVSRLITSIFSVKGMISVILILVVAMNRDIFFDAQNKVLLNY